METAIRGANCDLYDALRAPRIPGLDALRAVAVLLVLLDHSGLYSAIPPLPLDGGFGVEMFFVLSGFLITKILLTELEATGKLNLGNFYKRRAARLLPVFYAYLVVGLGLLLLRSKPVPWEAVAAAATYVVNYYQALTGAATHYLSHCWSLAVEEQFYFLWPLGLLLIVRCGLSAIRCLALLLLFVWLLKAVLIGYFDVADAYVYRSLETRSDQLAVGCLLAVVTRSVPACRQVERWMSRRWIAILVVAAIALSLNLNRDSVFDKYVVGYTLEPLLVALLIPAVVLAASGKGLIAQLLNFRPLILMGQISYGMYLCHPYIMGPVRNAIERTGWPASAAIGASIVAVTVAAYLSFFYFEQPLRQRINAWAIS